MTTIAERVEEWIAEACERFAAATGARLDFVRCAGEDAVLLESSWRATHPGRWFERIQADGEVVGLLYGDLAAESDGGTTVDRLAEIADLVSGLIGRAVTASSALASRTRDLSTLVEIGRDLPQQGDLVAAIRRLLRAAIDLTGLRAAAFFLVEPATKSLRLRMREGRPEMVVPAHERSLSTAVHDVEALVKNEVLVERERLQDADDWLPADARLGICLAIHSEDGPVGTLWLYDRRARQPSRRDWHVLRSIAAQFTGVLERAVLRQENAQQHRLRRELESVRGSQVFDFTKGVPKSAGYEIAAACTSRHEVGGDLCEVLPVDDHRVVLVVGDACGDSVPAALVMSAVRGAIRAVHGIEECEWPCPPEMMGLLNRILCDVTPPHQFMSLFFGYLDTRSGLLVYSNAGHPGPLRFRGEDHLELESHGLLLGILPETNYGHGTITIEPGDLLVAYTDGVTEAVRKGGKMMFRSEGVAGTVRGLVDQPVGDILSGIWGEVDRFSGGGADDDRTLLVVRTK